MSREPGDRAHPDRRNFLKTTSAAAAGALLLPRLEAVARAPGIVSAAEAASAGWRVQPFALTRVKLTESLFTQKRDRMLAYARGYGGDSDVFAGPDRVLSIFRANAGLDTKGARPVGSWENGTGYLRGHYAGHFMSMLAQAYAGTGDEIFKRKLDYIVRGLAECQDALAAAARRPTARSEGRFGGALRLTGSPIGLAEHVSLPAGVVSGLTDFTIALWINPAQYDRAQLSDSRPNVDPAALYNGTAVFDFGRPNPQFADPALARMYLTVRANNDKPLPRFAITTRGVDGEQRLDATQPFPIDRWTHVAITRSGTTATLYVDGEPVATNPDMTLSPADLGETTGNWLGRCQFPQRNVSYLNGQLDEFQIFDRALTPAEVRSLVTSAGGSIGGGNVAWYRFDENDGATARDSSRHERHGTIIAPTDGRRHPGFLSAYPETQFMRLEEFATYGGNQGIWAPYYTLHKILAGLLDAHTMAGNAQALEVASNIGDWAHSRLSRLRPEQFDRMWNMYIAGEYGGANDAFASLYALRRDKPEYLTVARYFDNRNVKAPTVAGTDILDGRHANQHIPQFIGYLRIYEQSETQEYYTAAKNFWDMVVPHRVYSHGGVGVGEILRKRDVIAGSLYSEPNNRNHAETCPLYNMLKLSRNLFFHEPDPKYMNYYEQGLFNQILGSRRDLDSTTSPEVTYFVPVRPGERRTYGNVGTCCGGTGMENHTKYQDSIYFRSADDATLYVNLYIPSVLEWREKGFTIEQVTRYPFEGASTLTVRGNGRLAIMLRVPSWVRRGYTVSVNGAAQRIDATPGRYVTIDRQWRAGDRIEIAMPLSFRAERTIDDPTVQSIFYGPTLLAVQASALGDTLETGLIDVSLYKHFKLSGDFGVGMTPIAGKPLHFSYDGRTLAPFFVADPQAGETQPYHVYVRRHEPRVVFGSVDTGVANAKRDDGVTFLDAVWAGAPFANHDRFVAAVERAATEWRTAGRLTQAEQTTIVQSARRAATDLA
ncbi:MAG TPA: beta-L-arabinofuranosidase domain-containing protein [Gemmatimonadaceae bacterium]|nr:beta-L-arabinofuranosidase domain-containing protein [Gemmatimonadaceae bacterium]